MPARQPFTALCQAAAQPRAHDRADLHVHTVHSDGLYTPAQVVNLSSRAGLRAVAITDHDTLAGIAPARQAAKGLDLEVIVGVEISASYQNREIHLLGYFVAPEHGELNDALASLQRGRTARFDAMIIRLREAGVNVPSIPATDPSGKALGRRSLAELLVQSGRVSSIREAFHRYLSDGGSIAGPKVLLNAANALAIIRRSGGVASWAHPPYDFMIDALPQLRDWGLGAVEALLCKPEDSRSLADAIRIALEWHSEERPKVSIDGMASLASRMEEMYSWRGQYCGSAGTMR